MGTSVVLTKCFYMHFQIECIERKSKIELAERGDESSEWSPRKLRSPLGLEHRTCHHRQGSSGQSNAKPRPDPPILNANVS
ncbi:hypothetical protein M0802_007495 [Mischocyttarus mexicanus]|nr:hypothetical protein M0802_007495 [Mischocyttarus mexicanus]